MSPIAVIIVLIAVVLTAVISVFATIAYRKSVSEAKVGSAEEKAREILDDALKTAEAKKREALNVFLIKKKHSIVSLMH